MEEIPEDEAPEDSPVMAPPPPQRRRVPNLAEPIPPLTFYNSTLTIQLPGTADSFRVYKGGNPTPTNTVLFCVHGAGFSGMSWALFTKCIGTAAQVFAMDLRAHGQTQTADEQDMSLDRLAHDVVGVVSQVVGNAKVILIGHSLGGAGVVRAASLGQIARLAGVFVLDVVEGTAIPALASMPAILDRRPVSFPSLDAAIEWSLANGEIRNKESAVISVPHQFVKTERGYVWRANLRATAPFWEGWFLGMTSRFLSLRVPKVLVVADSDRLDTPLTIGHMQGKFQLSVPQHCGHCINEDNPSQLSQIVIQFMKRYGLLPLDFVFTSGCEEETLYP